MTAGRPDTTQSLHNSKLEGEYRQMQPKFKLQNKLANSENRKKALDKERF